MGKEITTTVKVGTKAVTCDVHLDGTSITCRGLLKRAFAKADMSDLRVERGKLRFECGGDAVAIDLGEKADAWLDAIKNPRTRIQKLGVKHGMKVCVLGEAEQDALDELAAVIGEEPSRRLGKSLDLVFLFVTTPDQLSKLAAIEKSLVARGAVWALWPKGRKDLRHEEVVAAAKPAGLSQTKSVGFSEVFSGLRLVRAAKK